MTLMNDRSKPNPQAWQNEVNRLVTKESMKRMTIRDQDRLLPRNKFIVLQEDDDGCSVIFEIDYSDII